MRQGKAQDMQVFVEVLLNCSEETREVSEIRASEARMKAQVDSLQSRLDGPEHRAALDALKQLEVLPSHNSTNILLVLIKPISQRTDVFCHASSCTCISTWACTEA